MNHRKGWIEEYFCPQCGGGVFYIPETEIETYHGKGVYECSNCDFSSVEPPEETD